MALQPLIDTRPCPFCQEPIKIIARKCRHCGELLGDDANPGVWRDDKRLVMSRKATLPNRCVKSNELADGWLQRKYQWHQGGAVLQFLLGPLIYTVISQKIKIHVGLTDAWIRRRRWAIAIGWLSFAVGFVLFIIGLVNVDQRGSSLIVLVPIGLLVFLIGAIYGALRARMVTLARATQTHIWLNGVHPDYLASLPDWPSDT